MRLPSALIRWTLLIASVTTTSLHAQMIGTDSSVSASSQTEATFELIQLPYAPDALAPVISEHTVLLHHGKHLAGYVAKLNQLLVETKISERDLIQLVRFASGSVFDNAGQLLNHNLYFTQFRPADMQKMGEPKGALQETIKRSFGSFERFREQFEKAGVSIFGSGWLWLATNEEGRLYIDKEPNAGNPVTSGLIPLLGIDVWEHAYYLDYENRRAEHLRQIWHIIDWDVVGRRYDERQGFLSR